MAGIEEYAKNFNIKAAMSTLIISAFGFVAALFWRDAIKEAITTFVPAGEGLSYSFLSAIIVTIIAIIVIFILSKVEAFSVRETIKVNIKGKDVKITESKNTKKSAKRKK